MSMTRTIKFNIKTVIEEYIFCIESKDKETGAELLHSFNVMFINSDRKIQDGIYKYLQNSRLANEYEEFRNIQKKIEQFFTQLDALLES